MEESCSSGRAFELLFQSFKRALALLAELQKGFEFLAALPEDLGHAFQKGQPFPASGPFAPASRGKRAKKAACNFADEL